MRAVVNMPTLIIPEEDLIPVTRFDAETFTYTGFFLNFKGVAVQEDERHKCIESLWAAYRKLILYKNNGHDDF